MQQDPTLIIDSIMTVIAAAIAIYCFITGRIRLARNRSPRMQAAYEAKHGCKFKPELNYRIGEMRIIIGLILLAGVVVSDGIYFFSLPR